MSRVLRNLSLEAFASLRPGKGILEDVDNKTHMRVYQ